MDVDGVVGVLQRVDPLDLNEEHLVPLDPEVDRGRDPDVRDPEPVGVACPTSSKV